MKTLLTYLLILYRLDQQLKWINQTRRYRRMR